MKSGVRRSLKNLKNGRNKLATSIKDLTKKDVLGMLCFDKREVRKVESIKGKGDKK